MDVRSAFRHAAAALFIAGWAAGGCERWTPVSIEGDFTVRGSTPETPLEVVQRMVRPPVSPRTQYLTTLQEQEPADAQRWTAVGEQLLEAPVAATLPLRERVYWVPQEIEGVSYALELTRGRQLRVAFAEPFDGFLELFRVPELETAAGGPKPQAHRVVLAVDEGVSYGVPESGRYVLRLQPRVGVQGPLTLEISTAPSLAFPVLGKGVRAVQSFFGAPRERGQRTHHGIDVFAPRGTPVLAACDGVVMRVGTNRLGGNVVWLRSDATGDFLYYAHLSETAVESGQSVTQGTVLGTVGNSGNAKGGAPHLHFGIYGRTPVDPLPFVDDRARTPQALHEGPVPLGSWSVTKERTVVRAEPHAKARLLVRLDKGAALRPLALRGSWVRIELPDGARGWVTPRRVEPVARAAGLATPSGA